MSNINVVQTNGVTWGNINIEWKPISGGSGTRQRYQMWDATLSQPMWQTQGHGTAGDWYDIERGTTGAELNDWFDLGVGHPGLFASNSSTAVPSTGILSYGSLITSTNIYLHIFDGNGNYIGYSDMWTPFQAPTPFGQVGHILTNTGNSANLTSSSWSCISIANNEYSYRTSGVAAYDIKYDVTNDQWLDDSTAGWPTHFGTSTTDSTTITPTGASQYLYLYDNNQFICEIENDGYAVSSGSGSGGGPNPLSNNSSSTSSKKVFHNFW